MRAPTLTIVGLGVHLPGPAVTNEAWPAAVVASWQEGRTWSPERAKDALGAAASPGARAVLEAMQRVAGDPFQGAVRRHYLGPEDSATTMAAAAARSALESAGVEAGAVDFILGSSLVPDVLSSPDVSAVHHELALRPGCFTLSADAVCNSFQMQLAVAEGLLASGRYEVGLLVQCSAASRTTPMEQPLSVHFGDGATAAVVRRAEDGRGLLAQRFHTDGSIHEAMVLAPRDGSPWWLGGELVSTPQDRDQARRMLLTFADIGKELIAGALSDTGLEQPAVKFFGGHQATAWWSEVAQEIAGLSSAKTLQSYPFAGTLSAANLPLVLSTASREGLLVEGDVVVLFQGGTGATYAASVLVW